MGAALTDPNSVYAPPPDPLMSTTPVEKPGTICGTRAARQAVVVQGRAAAGAAERKPRRIEHRGREGVVLSERNPLISRGRQVAEISVIPLGVILKRVVNGIAGKERVVDVEKFWSTRICP